MHFTNVFSLIVLLVLPRGIDCQACLNSETYRKEIFGVEDQVVAPRSCSWIRFKEARRTVQCQDPDVVQNCPQTCGVCCDDDPSYIFDTNFDLKVSCSWIVRNPGRIDKRRSTYCEIPEIFENDVNIRDACPNSCNMCLSQVTLSPTVSSYPSLSQAPSKSPTKSPTVRPTYFPTKNPTKNPTDFPTRDPTKNPTDFPTRAPSRRPTVDPTSSPSASPTSIPSSTPTNWCEDDPDYVFRMDFNNFPVKCEWLTLSNKNKRKAKYCSRAAIKSACKNACDFCTCQDNWDFRFPLKFIGGVKKNCQWIAKNKKHLLLRRAKYCYKTNDMSIGSEIADQCPLSCGYCNP